MRVAILSLMMLGGAIALEGQDRPTAVPATPENAATFLGDWTIAADGSNGPATFAVTLKVIEGKVVGEVASAATGKQPVTSVSKAGASLQLRYAFDYQGMAINTIIVLTPAGEKVEAYLDFADGAAQMSGTATKKAS